MDHTLYSRNYIFSNPKFKRYHYTDNRHGSPMNYIAYIKKGNGKIVSPEKTIEFKEGDLFHIPMGLSYQSYWYGSDEIDFLSFGYYNLHITEPSSYELQIIDCDDSIKNKLSSLKTDSRIIDCNSLSIFYDVMSELIITLKQNTQNSNEKLIEKIKNTIKHNPGLSIAEISTICTISQSYLYSIFKKHTSMSPNDYRQEILCERGIDLLLTTDKKIEEIANMLGFSSGSYFRKVLKKHTKNTPKEIRKNRTF